MLWVLGVVAVVLGVRWLVRGRREAVAVFPAQPVSTLNSAWLRRTSKDTKAALNAATSMLR